MKSSCSASEPPSGCTRIARERSENDFRYDDRAEQPEVQTFRLRLVHRLEQDEEGQRRIVRKRFDVRGGQCAVRRLGSQPLAKLIDAVAAVGEQA